MSCLLEVEGLGKSFRGLKAISDLSFQVAEGDIFGLIGPNGAGKTTAINLIGGALKPDVGEVRFGGERITGLPPHELVRRGLVRTFQATTVYPSRTVWENAYRGAFAVAYAGFWHAFWNTARNRERQREVRQRIGHLLHELGLAAVGESAAGSLPYGYQKTLGLVIALAASPRLIMLDEPAAGLNAEEAAHVSTVVRKISAKGVSVIVVDHNMRFISSICNRVVVLHHGAELALGTPAEVTADRRVIEAYLGTQYEPA
jgi:branched-chain amino acid transport system ATP-binding protein